MGTRHDIISHYFDLLEETLIAKTLIEKPCNIFNMDETGMPLDPLAPKVVAKEALNILWLPQLVINQELQLCHVAMQQAMPCPQW